MNGRNDHHPHLHPRREWRPRALRDGSAIRERVAKGVANGFLAYVDKQGTAVTTPFISTSPSARWTLKSATRARTFQIQVGGILRYKQKSPTTSYFLVNTLEFRCRFFTFTG